ncbi:MAG: UDP-N-acetylmuramoyl-L-alanyl-D-glutamate--2,6-diaminopimelate ligase [Candidatus Dormibacteraeota bacterium]|nr:UDP-N-acetylmuramoyl-L-alanyl-D-glutamate--2,6-diaminopimelate ligase [Candidatus Dormibacteraeota bacterium]
MRLSQLAAEVPGAALESGGEHEVSRVVEDSRLAGPGDLFVAVPGLRVDGHAFAREAARAGAAVALERGRTVDLPPGTPVLRLAAARPGLAELAAVLHGRPAHRLLMAGVTGTDGKTTVTHMAAHVLNALGLPAGLLSGVARLTGAEPAANSTGLSSVGAALLQASLGEMVASGKRAAVLEVTSHALAQDRVAACELDAVAVTNVGHDHLDYHGSWESYLRAKAHLIVLCASAPSKGIVKTAVLNLDDPAHERLAAEPIARRLFVSRHGSADLAALELRPDSAGTAFVLAGPDGAQAAVRLRMPGAFNVGNALLAGGLAHALGGFPTAGLAAALSAFPGVPGRLEQVDLGQPFRVYVDFAHSASGLAGVLAELRALTDGRLLCVFGATGRSDHDRPGMGRAAATSADWFVITTDDPVSEDPAEIARAVQAGAHDRRSGVDYEVEPDRRTAIRMALTRARPGDTVLLAGKGHERTMILDGRTEPWDERGEAELALRELADANGRSV